MATTSSLDAQDRRWMARAVALGRRGLGRTHPNPPVGAVLVRGGRVIGEGWHRRAGGPHAEVVALRRAGRRARGATLYVTLEPCVHVGRTPPCVGQVVAAGVRRVVVGVVDPNPRVRGRGLRALRRAGVAVRVGVLRDETAELSAWFRHTVVHRRPFVLLKLASSLDGRIATAGGASRWLTGPRARRVVHRLRDQVDAVMVGAGTVRADDPALTCRVRGGRDPLRVVVDGRLRVSPRARVFRQRSRAATVVVAGQRPDPRRRRALERAGAEVVVLPARRGRIAADAVLAALAARGVTSVLVEGGGELAAALLAARRVDRLLVFIAPLLIGGDGRPMLAALGTRRLAAAPRLGGVRVDWIGPDLRWDATVQ